MSTTELNYDDYYWWKVPDDKIYESVFQYVAFLGRNQQWRHTANLKYLRLYSNYDILDMQTYTYIRSETTSAIQNRVTFNIIQSIIDTVVSKITKNKPKPTFLTEGGDFSLQTKAKNLTQFIAGQFDSTDFYREASRAFKDACIYGTGAVKILWRDGQLKAEHVFIDEIAIDDTESFYSEPRQMHQVKWMHRDVLIEMFPDKEKEIRDASSDQSYQTDLPYMNNPNMVYVIESWHLPASPESGDGKHAICISTATLFSEEWKKDYFPFIFWRWSERSIGFYGQGLAEQLQGLQLEINKILRTIQVSMHLVSIPKIYLEASSKVVDAHLDNKIGGIIRYAGTAPTHGPLATIPKDLFSHLDRLYTRAYEVSGVSQLSATSQKPAGLDSGKALREYNDIETERFMEVGQRYEEAFEEAAHLFIKEIKHQLEKEKEENGDEEKPDIQVSVRGEKFIKRIKWSDVDMDEDKYMMHIFPTSMLSSTPAGRLQDVQELLQAGFISQEEGRSLLDFPDLQGYYNLANADVEDIKRTIEEIVDDGKYRTPEPFQNLEFGIAKMQQAYLFYRSQELPESRLELMRRWMEDARALLGVAAEQPVSPQQQAVDVGIRAQTEGAVEPTVQGLQEVGEEPIPEELGGQVTGTGTAVRES